VKETIMSTLLDQHPPQLQEQQRERDVRRVSLPDRVALHLGLALITWSRRTHRPESRERRASLLEQHLARTAREIEAERRLLLQALPVR
jgi:hypothetical protein